MDAVCPLVSKVHVEAQRHYDAGREIAGHPQRRARTAAGISTTAILLSRRSALMSAAVATTVLVGRLVAARRRGPSSRARLTSDDATDARDAETVPAPRRAGHHAGVARVARGDAVPRRDRFAAVVASWRARTARRSSP